jgi:hypothetical protein
MEYITPYIDKELADDTCAQIERHLNECEKCRIEFRAYSGIKRLIAEKLEKSAAPLKLRQNIDRILLKQGKNSSIWFLRKRNFELRPLTGLAFAAMLILSVFSRDIVNKIYPVNRPNNLSQIESIKLTGGDQHTLNLEDGLNASVVGRIICITCYLKENYGAKCDCSLNGHHLGLLTDDGSLWSFADNNQADKLISTKNMVGKTLHIEGQIFYNAHFIDMNNYKLVDSE